MLTAQVSARTLDGERDGKLLVLVPMVGCPQGLITADGYDHSWCGRTSAEPIRCADGLVPDPAWVAAAEKCGTCGGRDKVRNPAEMRRQHVNTVSWVPCPDCIDGRPLIELRVECDACGSDRFSVMTCGVQDCFGGTISAGTWRLTGGPCVVVDRPSAAAGKPFVSLLAQGLAFFAPRGTLVTAGVLTSGIVSIDHLHDGDPTSLIGQSVCELGRVS